MISPYYFLTATRRAAASAAAPAPAPAAAAAVPRGGVLAGSELSFQISRATCLIHTKSFPFQWLLLHRQEDGSTYWAVDEWEFLLFFLELFIIAAFAEWSLSILQDLHKVECNSEFASYILWKHGCEPATLTSRGWTNHSRRQTSSNVHGQTTGNVILNTYILLLIPASPWLAISKLAATTWIPLRRCLLLGKCLHGQPCKSPLSSSKCAGSEQNRF